MTARVIVERRQDRVARLERDGRKRGIERVGRAMGEGDIARLAIEELGQYGVKTLDLVAELIHRFVAADLGFEAEDVLHFFQNRARRECGPGVVEMDPVFGAGRVAADFFDVHVRGFSGSNVGKV